MPYIIPAIGLALTATTTGLSMSGALTPSQPNLGAASAQLSNVEAELLPIQDQLEAAAQQGRSVTVNMPKHFTTQQMAYVPGATTTNGFGKAVQGQGQWVAYNPSDWQPGGKYASLGQPKLKSQNVRVPAGPQTFNFSGYGTADVQGQLANAMAQVKLALQQKYDPQFIQQSLQEEQQANPQGVQARQLENQLVQQQISQPLNEPVAQTLNNQVEQELQAANSGTLTPEMQNMLMQGGTAASSARGGTGTGQNTPNFAQPLTTGFAGQQNTLQELGAGMSELEGGMTPQDIEFRREQQNIGNLSSLVTGQTPESEFSSLSGAQGGATPFYQGQQLSQLPNTGNGAQSAALQSWQTQMQSAENQVNPWMAGLSTLLAGGNAAANLGYRPGAP